jgi:hypothetical protein
MSRHTWKDAAVLGILCLSFGACAWQSTFDDPRTVIPIAPAGGKHVQVMLTGGDLLEIRDAVIRGDSVSGIHLKRGLVTVPVSAVTEVRRFRLTQGGRYWMMIAAACVAGIALLRVGLVPPPG